MYKKRVKPKLQTQQPSQSAMKRQQPQLIPYEILENIYINILKYLK